ncbi:MAG: hypothetical protein EAZ85_14340 [Bacteroidetes bacterium]|nr:MAG: hypothetical protein EAZ85_14340 [Bacteroidota bacterium]TAG87738.1 MAG: hypothetical protein EAZ20_10030 [Bacteroidota bacterium]
MEDLAEKIAEKAKITPEQAKLAAEAAQEYVESKIAHTVEGKIAEYLKDISAMIKSQVHEALTGKPLVTMAERMGDFAEGAKDKLGDFAEGAKDKLGKLAGSIGSFFTGGKDKDDDKDEKKEEPKK